DSNGALRTMMNAPLAKASGQRGSLTRSGRSQAMMDSQQHGTMMYPRREHIVYLAAIEQKSISSRSISVTVVRKADGARNSQSASVKHTTLPVALFIPRSRACGFPNHPVGKEET